MDNQEPEEIIITEEFLDECIANVPLTCSECGMMTFNHSAKICEFCGK